MQISDFIKYVLDLARKEGKGNVVSPSVITNWLTFVMLDNFNDLLTQALTLAEQRNTKLGNVVFDVKDLRQFVKTVELTMPQAGAYGSTIVTQEWVLPSDFKYELGCTSGMTDVELLSSTLLPKYRGSALNGNPAESPKGFVGGGTLQTIPNDLSDVVLVYLRTPAKPCYDFCLDSLDNEIFMPAGSYVSSQSAMVDGIPPQLQANLYATDHSILATNVTKAGTYPIYSLTVELDWDETNHVRFANAVAHKLGINLKNPILTQTQ